jgi:hypothetical protein
VSGSCDEVEVNIRGESGDTNGRSGKYRLTPSGGHLVSKMTGVLKKMTSRLQQLM